MKRVILSLVLIIAMFAGVTIAKDATDDPKGTFNLVHWNILKQMYQLNGYVYVHRQSLSQTITDPKFLALVSRTFTPDSYAAVFDQNAIALIHPNAEVVGKNMSTVNLDGLRIFKKAMQHDTCVRGFYYWIDKQEKYMVICPIIGQTSDGYKLFYAYTMYTRSMPDYYIETLKNSALD